MNSNLCHLFHTQTDSIHVDVILDSFENSTSIDLNNTSEIGDYEIYIIELNQITKDITSKVKEIFKSKKDVLTYFIVPDKYNLIFFQLAFLLNAKTLITQKQDSLKVVKKIKSDYKIFIERNFESRLAESLINTQNILYFKDSELIYANKQFLSLFECKDLIEVKEKILLQIDLDKLLTDDILITKPIVNSLDKKETFLIKSMTLDVNNGHLYKEKFLSFESHVNNIICSELDFVLSKIRFIELLKDKLLEKSISNKSFSVITIHIENLKKIESGLTKIEKENFIKEFLIFTESILDKKIVFAQYNQEFYVTLFEDISFENLKKRAQNFHIEFKKFISKQKIVPVIGLFAFDFKNLELNDILVTLEEIQTNKQLKVKSNSESLEYINNFQESMSDSEIIDFMLEDALVNSKELKLLNIYNGLCINTASKILKRDAGKTYISFEQLQGIVMQNERETVLQFEEQVKDIRAKVKYIDLEKKFALIADFTFLNTNANERKYSRVTCSLRTPVLLSHHGLTINGEILDISVNSIAVKTKLTKRINEIKSKNVTLTFTLPIKSSHDGFVKLKLDAKVLFVSCDDENCKIITELDQDTTDEAILMEYVYNRQKELIVEVKKMVKLA